MRKLPANLLTALALAASASTASAAIVVVPGALSGTSTGSGLNTVIRDLPRTYQFGINASELTAIPAGTPITGMAFRLCNFATCSFNGQPWPPQTITWATYDVQVGSSLLPVPGLSTTFANNMAADTVLARSGSFSYSPGVFPFVNNFPGAPNGFGPCIEFTNPFTYPGGTPLLVTIRHPGYVTAGIGAFAESTVGTANPTVQALSATTQTGTVGAAATFTIVKLRFPLPVAYPDLQISKTLAPGQPPSMTPGGPVMWDITVTNVGGPLTNGSMTDELPTCLVRPIVCATDVQCMGGVSCGTCTAAATSWSVTGFQLAAGGNPGDSITFRVTTRAGQLAPFTCNARATTTYASSDCGAPTVREGIGTVEIAPFASQASVDILESKLDSLPCELLRMLDPKGASTSSSGPCN